MAAYFSRRKLKPKEREEAGELNIVPYLDILMNLIIFMLMSITGLAAFGILNVSAPNYGGPSAGMADEASAPKLLLTVGIATKGFFVAATGAVLGADAQQPTAPEAAPGDGQPTIPKKADGEYDFETLNAKMAEIKRAFPTETKVIIAAQNEVSYEHLVRTMDACRETFGSSRQVLFPDVTLGAF